MNKKILIALASVLFISQSRATNEEISVSSNDVTPYKQEFNVITQKLPAINEAFNKCDKPTLKSFVDQEIFIFTGASNPYYVTRDLNVQIEPKAWETIKRDIWQELRKINAQLEQEPLTDNKAMAKFYSELAELEIEEAMGICEKDEQLTQNYKQIYNHIYAIHDYTAYLSDFLKEHKNFLTPEAGDKLSKFFKYVDQNEFNQNRFENCIRIMRRFLYNYGALFEEKEIGATLNELLNNKRLEIMNFINSEIRKDGSMLSGIETCISLIKKLKDAIADLLASED